MTLELRDTPGQDSDHFEKDSLSYVDVEEEISRACAAADVALVCFSITDPESFGHVRTKVKFTSMKRLAQPLLDLHMANFSGTQGFGTMQLKMCPLFWLDSNRIDEMIQGFWRRWQRETKLRFFMTRGGKWLKR